MSEKVQVMFGEQAGKSYRTDGLGTIGFKIVAVDGETVRKDKEIDFTMGGNHGAYSWIPKGEIWIDDVYVKGSPADLNAIILHEMVEAFVMERFGLEYEVAHEIANASEVAVREVVTKGKKP